MIFSQTATDVINVRFLGISEVALTVEDVPSGAVCLFGGYHQYDNEQQTRAIPTDTCIVIGRQSAPVLQEHVSYGVECGNEAVYERLLHYHCMSKHTLTSENESVSCVCVCVCLKRISCLLNCFTYPRGNNTLPLAAGLHMHASVSHALITDSSLPLSPLPRLSPSPTPNSTPNRSPGSVLREFRGERLVVHGH